MGKNKGKGGKSKRKGTNKSAEFEKRELVTKEQGQEYGQITKILGNCRLEVLCSDGQLRMGHIRGTLTKKVWISRGDIVLVSLRDYQDEKCDIMYKYNMDEIKRLKNMGVQMGNIAQNINIENNEEENLIDFNDDPSTNDSDHENIQLDDL
jgi:translation initiation factor 1A